MVKKSNEQTPDKPARVKKVSSQKTKLVKTHATTLGIKVTQSKTKRDYLQTVGRRKRAVARLRFSPQGQGSIIINSKDYRQYFPYSLWQSIVSEPLPLVGLQQSGTITVKVAGGGLAAQAVAVRLALARALILHNPDWRPTLRKMGWLTRDPREKERKKPGLKRARRGPQWAKR